MDEIHKETPDADTDAVRLSRHHDGYHIPNGLQGLDQGHGHGAAHGHIAGISVPDAQHVGHPVDTAPVRTRQTAATGHLLDRVLRLVRSLGMLFLRPVRTVRPYGRVRGAADGLHIVVRRDTDPQIIE